MKPYLAILLVIFLFIETHGSRVKRGLSADEQKKFLEELNKDRKRVAQEEGIDYVPVKYDASLEKEIVPGKRCFEHRQYLLPLQYNDVAEQLRKHYMASEGDNYQYYFLKDLDRIGCSKEFKCTAVLEKHGDIPLELQGKTIEYHGVCVQGESDPGAKSEKLKKAKTPSPNKYGDILGIPAISGTGRTDGKQGSEVEGSGKDGAGGEQRSGAGSVFSLTIFLFLVLYT
ncbi:hypothetical protein CAEBREN_13456 [Caenorhabditis brenneri]|uniref:Uncharacterized protein n=1 Tax=Caenorhabditis brenneri TaxID=135651 RepID=G0N7E3_CAEBE|nr:hypothetical protein CAEBREN_13456 [Caenorhabditis brenneri]